MNKTRTGFSHTAILTKEVIESLGFIALHEMSSGNMGKDTQVKARECFRNCVKFEE